nr:CopG family antitoxin [Marinospirillum minutulum]
MICTKKRGIFINKSKQIPNFKTEAEERQFWEKHDSTDYLDWKQAKAVIR